MKKNSIKAIACVLAGSLICTSLAGCGKEKSVVETVVSDEQILNSVIEKVVNQGSSTANKEETVYVKTNANGNISTVTVSNWLKNNGSTEKLEDASSLKDIVNVKGDEDYTVEGDKIVWNANGNDIYYQGTTDKEIPVEVNITYTLDGKTVSPDEIAGKSGHVSINFEYTNNAKKTVKIGDKDQTIYTPFVVASGLLLDNENFKNISVTNGTVVSDGSKQVVLGMAFPGLVDSLNGDEIKDSEVLEKIEDKLNIPSNVTIEADAENFELGMTLTVVSSDVMGALGLNEVNVDGDMDEVKEKVEDFKDATSQLLDGSKKLSNGAGELYDGTGKLKDGSAELANGITEYTNGVSKVSDGFGQLSDGANRLDNGISELSNGASKISAGATSLKNGITSAEGGASSLSDGAKKVDEGAKTLKAGIDSASEGAKALDAGIISVDEGAGNLAVGAGQLKDGVNELVGTINTISSGVNSAADGAAAISGGINAILAATAVETEVTDENIQNIAISVDGTTLAGILAQNGVTAAALGIPDAQYNALIDACAAATSGIATQAAQGAAVTAANNTKSAIGNAITGNGIDAGASQLAAGLRNSANQLSSEEAAAKLTALVNGAGALANGAGDLKEGTKKLSAGSGKLVGGLDQLAEGSKEFVKGTGDLSKGSKTLAEGLSQLKSGAGELSDGTSTLAEGASQLKDGSSALLEGTSKLSSGLGQLTANSDKLRNGSKELADGAVKLSDGAFELLDGTKKLNDGMVQFDEEGVQKLSSVFDTNLSTMSDRIRAITDLAKEYKSFTGSSKDEDCAVRFIIESEGIKNK